MSVISQCAATIYTQRAYCPFFINYKVVKIFQVKWTNSPSPSRQSRRRWFSLFPPADPVCRIKPGRSGRSWTCEGWRAAVSRSVPEQDPLRCGHKHKPAPSTTTAIKINQFKIKIKKSNMSEICFKKQQQRTNTHTLQLLFILKSKRFT